MTGNNNTEILKVNQAFYDAFAAGDYAVLETLWAGLEEVSVIHPGGSALHGRKAVMRSWRKILSDPGVRNIHCANPVVYAIGAMAYVICNEIFPEGQLIATNIFVLENGSWRMLHHQAGPDNQFRRDMPDFTGTLH